MLGEEYNEGEDLKPPFFRRKGIGVSDEEKDEWQRDWFDKEVLEKKFEQIARIMGSINYFSQINCLQIITILKMNRGLIGYGWLYT